MNVAGIVPAFLVICPGLATPWKEYLAFWEESDDRGIDNDVAVIGQYIVDQYEKLQLSDFSALFSMLVNGLANPAPAEVFT